MFKRFRSSTNSLLRTLRLPQPPQFERFVRETGSAAALGTYSRDLAVVLLRGLQAPRNEVLVPSYMCNTLVDAILSAHAVPVFYEVDSESAFSGVESVVRKQLTERTAAVVFVDYFGVPCDVDAAFLQELRQRGIASIRDASHAYLTLVQQNFKGVENFDYVLTSIYKSLPTRIGALLFSKERIAADAASFRELLRTTVRSILIPWAIFLWNPLIRRGMTELRSHQEPVELRESLFRLWFGRVFRKLLTLVDENAVICERQKHAQSIFAQIEGSTRVRNVFSRSSIDQAVLWGYPVVFATRADRDSFCAAMQAQSVDVRTWPTFPKMRTDPKNWERLLLLPLAEPLGPQIEHALMASRHPQA